MGWASWTTRSVVTGRGGVDTVEAGVLRGELDIHTSWSDGLAAVAVRPHGGSRWFTVAGSPAPCATGYASRRLHDAVIAAAQGDGPASLAGRRPGQRREAAV
ncbi:hypothetical protein ABZ128_25700 [Streptomyces sp. NPDC006326]|uniref:hypothetical protein n=1 Tax=Streptomyces sp. NPDC006326 TaxID=3156752 RepID=UPI0033BD0839